MVDAELEMCMRRLALLAALEGKESQQRREHLCDQS